MADSSEERPTAAPDRDLRPAGPLRKGWTTGACAAAAARAACEGLLTGRFPDPVSIVLPQGQRPSFPLARTLRGVDWAMAGVIKDAGDDPDVTHGALVLARVRAGPPRSGVTFRAGEGVGTVTRPGLALAVGEPAINPGPRAMIARAIADTIDHCGGASDFEVSVAIPGGERLAAKTLNARLGIVGGLSILGTTGIVVPFSCSAWIHSIHRGIDVARAASLDHIAAATGSTSEAAVKALYGLSDTALIDMGDFVGGTLKYLRRHDVPWLTVAGGFGKLAKLAAGHLDLHSARSRVDIGALGQILAQHGASDSTVARASAATSAGEVLALAEEAGVKLADVVAYRARGVTLDALAGPTAVDVVVFDRGGRLIGRAGP
ncbi:MAG TPA: cobalt-precorrin-5B (C(1))-methyltransferase [Alphaproteobacteria bacterium]|nr:cobalt-precorrin-5B (C(1))-methyltransferase [Alphaproteobacteria bacterium]